MLWSFLDGALERPGPRPPLPRGRDRLSPGTGQAAVETRSRGRKGTRWGPPAGTVPSHPEPERHGSFQSPPCTVSGDAEGWRLCFWLWEKPGLQGGHQAGGGRFSGERDRMETPGGAAASLCLNFAFPPAGLTFPLLPLLGASLCSVLCLCRSSLLGRLRWRSNLHTSRGVWNSTASNSKPSFLNLSSHLYFISWHNYNYNIVITCL